MSLCAFHIRRNYCMPEELFIKLCEKLKIDKVDAAKNPKVAIARIMKELDVEFEHEIFEHGIAKQVANLDDDECKHILHANYLPPGQYRPKPLNNTEVDSVLDLLEIKHPDFFNLHINMINFEEYGGTLAQLRTNINDIVAGKSVKFKMPETYDSKEMPAGKKRFAAVLNSDKFGNGGKHWTCIFVDLRGPAITIEFFNSSGNPPYPQVREWAIKFERDICKSAIADKLTRQEMFITASEIQHQKGETECGVYCIYYIYHRLDGMDHRAFKRDPIPDNLVTEFRHKIFRPGKS